MHIPLVYEHLFYKYFVRRSGYKRQKSFATYGCCHPCFSSLYFKHFLLLLPYNLDGSFTKTDILYLKITISKLVYHIVSNFWLITLLIPLQYRYLGNEVYYRVSNLDGRLDTPDHCLTDDIAAFSSKLGLSPIVTIDHRKPHLLYLLFNKRCLAPAGLYLLCSLHLNYNKHNIAFLSIKIFFFLFSKL